VIRVARTYHQAVRSRLVGQDGRGEEGERSWRPGGSPLRAKIWRRVLVAGLLLVHALAGATASRARLRVERCFTGRIYVVTAPIPLGPGRIRSPTSGVRC
jgi:hypothetical protein